MYFNSSDAFEWQAYVHTKCARQLHALKIVHLAALPRQMSRVEQLTLSKRPSYNSFCLCHDSPFASIFLILFASISSPWRASEIVTKLQWILLCQRGDFSHLNQCYFKHSTVSLVKMSLFERTNIILRLRDPLCLLPLGRRWRQKQFTQFTLLSCRYARNILQLSRRCQAASGGCEKFRCFIGALDARRRGSPHSRRVNGWHFCAHWTVIDTVFLVCCRALLIVITILILYMSAVLYKSNLRL